MATTHPGIDGYVGNTPLIRLRRLSELTGCEILGKAEFMNPAGSVKDRAAREIITEAEQQGRLKSGATIVEGTAGNTGIGLAVIGRAKGYRTVIVIPNNQSPEKMHLLRTLGAEVRAVVTVTSAAGHDLRGGAVELVASDGRAAKRALNEYVEGCNRTDAFVLTAPDRLGEFTWTVRFPRQAIGCVEYDA